MRRKEITEKYPVKKCWKAAYKSNYIFIFEWDMEHTQTRIHTRDAHASITSQSSNVLTVINVTSVFERKIEKEMSRH